MSVRRQWVWTALAAAIPGAGQTHHSAAMFDHNRCLSLTGTVQKINLSYPHGWLWLQSVDGKAGAVNWALELTDPASLRVQGWAPGTVRKGAIVSVVAHPIRDGRKIAVAAATRLPDGKVVTGGGPSKCALPWGQPAK